MNLLVLTNNEDGAEPFEEYFESVDSRSLADAAIMTGPPSDLTVDGTPLDEYDAVYLEPEPKATIYARVLLECVQEGRVNCNLDPSSLFIMAKKHYLYKVLSEKDVPIPTTIAVSTEKGLSDVEKDMEFPIVAKMYEGFKRIDIEKIESQEQLESFAERAEHGTNVIIIQQFIEGDVFDSLYIDGDIVTVRIQAPWGEDTGSSGKKYHTLPTEQQELITQAAESIGTDVCRVKLVGDRIVQVESNPRLEAFQEASGRNVYGKVAAVLKGDDD